MSSWIGRFAPPGMKLPKMEPKHDGPFKILAQVGSQSYTLELAHSSHCLGRPADGLHGPPPSGPVPIETVGPMGERAQGWEVERILDHRDTGRGITYYIEWVGGTRDDRSWEPQSSLTNCKELLQEYLEMLAIATPSAQSGGPAPAPPSRSHPGAWVLNWNYILS
jgi:hypothetical protein